MTSSGIHRVGDQTSVVNGVAAISWQGQFYSARCLGVENFSREGKDIATAVYQLVDDLPSVITSSTELGMAWDDTELWQPLPVEMIVPIDIHIRVTT